MPYRSKSNEDAMKQACKHLLRVAVCAVMVSAASVPAVWAQASHLDTPLMVVRFNQDRVYYQQPLYNAVARALEAKPGVMFNIITLIPQTGNERLDKKATVEAQTNTNTLVADMVKMGVPQNRMRVSYQNGSNIESGELHLFVE